MNTLNVRNFRFLAVAALIAAGIATTISSGGGGGGADGGFDGNAPTLAITADNAADVASALVISAGYIFDLGDISGGSAVAQNSPPLLSDVIRKNASMLSSVTNRLVESCPVDGTVDITATLANPPQLTVGDRIIFVFDNCDDGEGWVISGTVDLTIAALQGDPQTDVVLTGFDVLLTDVTLTDGIDTFTANGDFRLTLDALAFPVITMTVTGQELALGVGTTVTTFIEFEHSATLDGDLFAAEAFGRMSSPSLGGSVDYETTAVIRAIGNFDPYEGAILVSGAGRTSVRIVIVDSSHVTLEIDTNGDGVVDNFVDTNWAVLNGRTSSSITSDNVEIVAREVHNATAGFGSLALVAGSQFSPNGAFGQVQLQGLSGSFGPVTVNCAVSGTAEVSGSIATGGTFTPGDSLQANFTACVRGTERLDGLLEVTVDSYLGTAGSNFVVTANATESGLRRWADGTCFFGVGTYHTVYDLGIATPGVILADSNTTAFNVSAGGRNQTVNGAAVTAQIQIGQPVPSVSRDSSGTMSGTDLTGSFGYFSVAPDVFVVDGDSSTGPSTGELLVTAGDGTTLRLIALDDLNVRLDADYNGDGVIDEQILTTWAELGYGNAFGICDLPLP